MSQTVIPEFLIREAKFTLIIRTKTPNTLFNIRQKTEKFVSLCPQNGLLLTNFSQNCVVLEKIIVKINKNNGILQNLLQDRSEVGRRCH